MGDAQKIKALTWGRHLSNYGFILSIANREYFSGGAFFLCAVAISGAINSIQDKYNGEGNDNAEARGRLWTSFVAGSVAAAGTEGVLGDMTAADIASNIAILNLAGGEIRGGRYSLLSELFYSRSISKIATENGLKLESIKESVYGVDHEVESVFEVTLQQNNFWISPVVSMDERLGKFSAKILERLKGDDVKVSVKDGKVLITVDHDSELAYHLRRAEIKLEMGTEESLPQFA